MKRHRTIQADLYGYLKNELTEGDRKLVEQHLTSCRVCRDELAALREADGLLAKNVIRASEQRGELYWQHFAEKVARRIEADAHAQSEPSMIERFLDLVSEHRKPFGVGFASALSLVAVAFAVWSIWMKPAGGDDQAESLAPSTTSSRATLVRNASLELRTREYLDQSKVLLIGLMNTDPKSLAELRSVLDGQRQVSKTLGDESQDLASALSDPSQLQLRELVSDLGVILMQIANLDAERDLRGVEIVKSGVERKGLLFKINLEQMLGSSQEATSQEHETTHKPRI
jgi:hypothetical protein